MEIKVLEGEFSVCKVEDYSLVNRESEFCFTARTEEERSLVCLTEDVPSNTAAREDGWRGMRIEGVLDFSLIGILAELSAVLAEKGIGIFVISTYNTDYIFVKRKDMDKAAAALAEAGHTVKR